MQTKMLICMISIWVCWINTPCKAIHFRFVLHLTPFDSISIRLHASQHNHMRQFFFRGRARLIFISTKAFYVKYFQAQKSCWFRLKQELEHLTWKLYSIKEHNMILNRRETSDWEVWSRLTTCCSFVDAVHSSILSD